VVLGDVNIDLLRDTVASRALLENFESLSLKNVNERGTDSLSDGGAPISH
jgi:hypothetical protein